MWFDSHFHLNGLSDTWQPSHVAGGLAVGVDALDWQLTRDKLKSLAGDWRQAVGFHPWVARENLPWQQLEVWLNNDACLALGEIGLDGSPRRRLNRAVQWDVFVRQVKMACDSDRVMSLHLVHDDELGYQHLRGYAGCRGIVHGFTGSLQQALHWQRLGFYIGIGARILNDVTERRACLLQALDPSFVLLETDAPYGRLHHAVSSPDTIAALGVALASVWGVSVYAVEQQCQNNWIALWGLR